MPYLIPRCISVRGLLNFVGEWIKTLLLKSMLAAHTATRLAFLLPYSWARFVRRVDAEQESRHAVAFLLNNCSCKSINLIDVGCYKGAFLREFQPLIRKRICSIGVDPIRYRHAVPYSYFVQVAIANEPQGLRSFYEYTDPSFNSLKRFSSSSIARNNESRSGGFRPPRALATRTVKTMRLSSIIKQLGMENEIIHFLKIDVQGCDLEAFLSLQEYIKNCLFIQLETLCSEDKNASLYENQTTFKEERSIIESLGFELFSCVGYSSKIDFRHEADVIFLNRELLHRYGLKTLLRSVMKEKIFFVRNVVGV